MRDGPYFTGPMIDFLRKMWSLARPYRGRLLLGLFFGVVYGLSSGALVIMIRWVVNGRLD